MLAAGSGRAWDRSTDSGACRARVCGARTGSAGTDLGESLLLSLEVSPDTLAKSTWSQSERAWWSVSLHLRPFPCPSPRTPSLSSASGLISVQPPRTGGQDRAPEKTLSSPAADLLEGRSPWRRGGLASALSLKSEKATAILIENHLPKTLSNGRHVLFS